MRRCSGLLLLLVWHYCLWFVPSLFSYVPLLDNAVTTAWIIDLASTGLGLLVIPLALGRKAHLTNHRLLGVAMPLLLAAGTFYITLYPFAFDSLTSLVITSVTLGLATATFWIYCGEFYLLYGESMEVRTSAPLYGVSLLIGIACASLLPAPLCMIFVACLPLASGGLLLLRRFRVRVQRESLPAGEPGDHNHDDSRNHNGSRNRDDSRKCGKAPTFPLLLPKQTARHGLHIIYTVCLVAFVVSIACYYLLSASWRMEVTLVHWQLSTEWSFTLGVGVGALLVLVLALITRLLPRHSSIFRLFPWLVVATALAFVLYLEGSYPNLLPFIIALAVASVFEFFLTIYFSILTTKGYVPSALAFGLSAGSVRLGFAIGNLLAILYGNNPPLALMLAPLTSLVCVALLLISLIALVYQEHNIASLVTTPPASSELNNICGAICSEFSLSAREGEVLRLMAHGLTTYVMAQKLVISPYTVNTHIQHIYEKMQIHKRSDLLNYINAQRGDI